MGTLYELTTQANALYELLQAEEIDEQTFNDTLEALGAGEKVESYCKVIKQLQSDVEMFKTEIDRLTARKKTTENGIDRMKNALLAFLQYSGQDKVKAGSFAVSTATTQAVQITDETAIPCAFLVEQPPKIDKIGIKNALKAGEEISGAELINNLGVRIR
jgi:chaperonin cofactor prefoldin